MKRIDRYVLAGFFGGWLASSVFFLGMYVVIHFFNQIGDVDQASEAFREKGWSPFQGFCRFYGFNFPFLLVETAPFTILMGAMWGLQQMGRRGELTAIVTSGVSFRRLSLPIIISAFIISLGFATLRERVLPRLAPERAEMEKMFEGKSQLKISRIPLISDSAGNLYDIASYDIGADVAQGVDFIPKGADLNEVITISEMAWRDAGPEGRGWFPTPGAVVQGPATWPLPSDLTPRDIRIEARGLLFLPVDDLHRMVRRNPNRPDLRVLLHAHYAYPLSPVILLLLGLPLVLRVRRQSPFVAAGASLLLSLSFYAVQNVMQDLGARGELLEPPLGVWLPQLLFGAVAVILYETMPT